MAKKSLTAKQKAYVDNRSKGISKDRSAIMAGVAENTHQKFEESEAVKAELARVRAEVIKNTHITREQVVAMFVEAGDFARMLGDPQGMVAAARELGKMLGFYAPEVKKTLHGIDQASLKKALKDLDDDELYKLVHARTIEGESVRQLPQLEAPRVVLQENRHMQELHQVESGPGSYAGSDGGSPPEEEAAA